VRWGRSVYANIQKFIQFQLTVNVAALVINVVAAISSGDVPLNAVQVLSLSLSLCAWVCVHYTDGSMFLALCIAPLG
jgi:magnesium-transporting ATPase (P-type)